MSSYSKNMFMVVMVLAAVTLHGCGPSEPPKPKKVDYQSDINDIKKHLKETAVNAVNQVNANRVVQEVRSNLKLNDKQLAQMHSLASKMQHDLHHATVDGKTAIQKFLQQVKGTIDHVDVGSKVDEIEAKAFGMLDQVNVDHYSNLIATNVAGTAKQLGYKGLNETDVHMQALSALKTLQHSLKAAAGDTLGTLNLAGLLGGLQDEAQSQMGTVKSGVASVMAVVADVEMKAGKAIGSGEQQITKFNGQAGEQAGDFLQGVMSSAKESIKTI